MKTFKLIMLIALIFATGFVGGVVTTRIVVRHFIHRAIEQPDLLRERIEHNLHRRLRLNADQQKQIHGILLDAHTQIKTLRQQFQPEFNGIISNAQAQISVLLTPEQQARLSVIAPNIANFFSLNDQNVPISGTRLANTALWPEN